MITCCMAFVCCTVHICSSLYTLNFLHQLMWLKPNCSYAAAVEQARSVSCLDCVKADLNHDFVLLGLVWHMLIVFVNC